MNRCVFFIFISITFSVNSQNLTEEFKLTTPDSKFKSVYNKLTVIDARVDTTNMGVIQKGAFNRKAFLKALVPLKKQIQDVFQGMIQSEQSTSRELVLNIRDFKFAELTEAFRETGYCYFRADLFSKKDSLFQKIDSVDAVYTVNSTDVTKKNIKNGTNKLIDFLSSNVAFIKSGANYSLEDIQNIVALEKRKIPIYNATVYKDGIYQTFNNFKYMRPAATPFEITKNKKGKSTKLERIWNDGASRAEVNPADIYCVIKEGKIYKTSEYGFAPVEFRENDFYFQEKAKVSSNSGDVILATAFFGIIGGILAGDASEKFEMKIDHLNGSSVIVKQLTE